MKIKYSIICAILIILSSINAFALDLTIDGNTTLYEGPTITLLLNGNTFVPQEGQMPPVIIENRTLVPVREVFENLGGSVAWDGDTRTVTVQKGESTIKLVINNKLAQVNDEQKELDVPAKIINNKTMVPVRFISENCGLTVSWDGATSTVSITEPTPVEPEVVVEEPQEPVNAPSNQFAIKAFNEKFSRYFGDKKTKSVAYQLCDLAKANNAGGSDNTLTVTLIDEKEEKISSDEIAQIHDITSNILKFNNASYEITGNYNENGYLVEIVFKRLAW
jgi:hypothetical protein